MLIQYAIFYFHNLTANSICVCYFAINIFSLWKLSQAKIIRWILGHNGFPFWVFQTNKQRHILFPIVVRFQCKIDMQQKSLSPHWYASNSVYAAIRIRSGHRIFKYNLGQNTIMAYVWAFAMKRVCFKTLSNKRR